MSILFNPNASASGPLEKSIALFETNISLLGSPSAKVSSAIVL